MNEKIVRLAVFIFAAVLHILVILFMAFNVDRQVQEELENARIMKLTDLDELPPPPPPEEVIPQVEAIAETMIETETVPVQTIVPAGTLTVTVVPTPHNFEDDYLPMHKVSNPPQFDANAIASDLVYPPIALRSGIEGRVILELFVDTAGIVQRIRILLEEPKDRGFGDAAEKAFAGRKGKPALANGEPVSARYRYPVSFKIK